MSDSGPAPAAAGRLPTRRLLCAAALLHLSTCVLLHLAGRLHLWPGLLAESGLTLPLTPDQGLFLDQANRLAAILGHEGLVPWLQRSAQLHVKLYSLSFLATRPLLPPCGLAAEPLNLIYYLLILRLSLDIGRAALGPRAARLATIAVAVWPSFLLCSTQLLRDPLFITALLLLLRAELDWLIGAARGVGRGALRGLLGGLAVLVLWIVRWDMQELVLGLVALGAGLGLWRQVRRGFDLGRLVSLLALCTVTLLSPRLTEASRGIGLFPPRVPGLALARQNPGDLGACRGPLRCLRSAADALAFRADLLRRKFLREYPGAGSNIDAAVRFRSGGDLLRYLPRALGIALFAPFPSDWLSPGALAGRAGRLLSGAEMLACYAAQALALLSILRRRSLPVLLLFGSSVLGLLALGAVVLNIGTLYRLRYGFFVPLCLLGGDGLLWLCGWRAAVSAARGGGTRSGRSAALPETPGSAGAAADPPRSRSPAHR